METNVSEALAKVKNLHSVGFLPVCRFKQSENRIPGNCLRG